MRAVVILASALLVTVVTGQQFGGGAWNPQAFGGGPNFGGPNFGGPNNYGGGGYQGDGEYGRQFSNDEPRRLPLSMPGVPLDGNTPVDPFLGPLKRRPQPQVPARALKPNGNRKDDLKSSNNNQQANNHQQQRSAEQDPMANLDRFYKSLTGELTKTPNGMGLGIPEGGQGMQGPNY